jgi:hypothetical protein
MAAGFYSWPWAVFSPFGSLWRFFTLVEAGVYYRGVPYWNSEPRSVTSHGLSEQRSSSSWVKTAQSFFVDLFGYIRALYTVSRPECPHCFYCGKPATRCIGERDLCERHSKVDSPSDLHL